MKIINLLCLLHATSKLFKFFTRRSYSSFVVFKLFLVDSSCDLVIFITGCIYKFLNREVLVLIHHPVLMVLDHVKLFLKRRFRLFTFNFFNFCVDGKVFFDLSCWSFKKRPFIVATKWYLSRNFAVLLDDTLNVITRILLLLFFALSEFCDHLSWNQNRFFNLRNNFPQFWINNRVFLKSIAHETFKQRRLLSLLLSLNIFTLLFLLIQFLLNLIIFLGLSHF